MYKILNFYTDRNLRPGMHLNIAPVTPREFMLPFQYRRTHYATALSYTAYLEDCNGVETDITAYFGSNVVKNAFTSVDFIDYNGQELLTQLPVGTYSLKIDDTYGIYYSDWFKVVDLNLDIITGWTNTSFGTLTTSGLEITAAVAAGASVAYSSTYFDLFISRTVKITYTLTLNSGVAPDIAIYDNTTSIATAATSSGTHTITLTPTVSSEGLGRVRISTSGASNFSLTNVSVYYGTGEYVKIAFTNTYDLRFSQDGTRDILYQNAWIQQVYFEGKLNNPDPRFTKIGNDYAGVFIPERVTLTPVYKLVAYVGRELYEGLALLPLHKTVTFTSETGQTFTPEPGNAEVEIAWNDRDPDSGLITITFWDSVYDWVSIGNNIT